MKGVEQRRSNPSSGIESDTSSCTYCPSFEKIGTTFADRIMRNREKRRYLALFFTQVGLILTTNISLVASTDVKPDLELLEDFESRAGIEIETKEDPLVFFPKDNIKMNTTPRDSPETNSSARRRLDEVKENILKKLDAISIAATANLGGGASTGKTDTTVSTLSSEAKETEACTNDAGFSSAGKLSSGESLDCSAFAKYSYLCGKYGDRNDSKSGLSANEACCACGGKALQKSTCVDNPSFLSVGKLTTGEPLDCLAFSKHSNSLLCDKYGDKSDPSSGLTANGSCCACGGQSKPIPEVDTEPIEDNDTTAAETIAPSNNVAAELVQPATQLPSFNATMVSLSTCEMIEDALSYLTSLDFDERFYQKDFEVTSKKLWVDVYFFDILVFPISFVAAFFGSSLLLPACTMTAAGLGVFLVFHIVNEYVRGGLECQMKLALSGVSAVLAAMGAAAFVRFGLFTLGAVTCGVGSYLFFDAFPEFDPGHMIILQENHSASQIIDAASSLSETSDISPYAWVITIIVALMGGLLLRVYEQNSLEVITAVLGGVGVSYSVHTFVIIQGGKLDRSIAFLIASAVAIVGWRFQHGRRLKRAARQLQLPQHTPSQQLPTFSAPMQTYAVSPPHASSPVFHSNPTEISQTSWSQIQHSIDSTNHLLQQNANNNAEEIARELAGVLNAFQEQIQDRSKTS